LAASAAIFGVLVWRLGTGPFLDGVRTVDGRALAAAAGLALVTTVACAWRWKIVASGLGVQLSLPGAVAAYYRSLFLNLTLPGGVVGDVHRGLRGVAWERLAGQAVQAVVTVAVLLALPSPVQSSMPLIAIAAVAVAACVVLAARAHGRFWRAAVADIRDGLLARRAWLGVALACAVVVVGHAATFVIAARTAGVTEPTSRL